MASTKIAGLAKPPNTSNNIRDKISMHDCLLVSEILSNILNTYDASTKAGTSSLLALATTCRIFQQPALDVLYRDLKSISTLIKCLPRDLWEEVGESRKRLLCFRRPLVAEDWRIFLSYSARVKSIGFRGVPTSHILDADVLRTLSLNPKSTLLFPNLQELSWDQSREEMLPLIRAFFGPLTRLHLHLEKVGIMHLSLLSSLQVAYPSLLHFSLGCSLTSDALLKAVSNLVMQWHRLESLSCGLLTQEAWAHIALLPTLRQLQVELPDDILFYSTVSTKLGHLPAFNHLKSLHLFASSLTSCTAVLRLLSSSRIETIHLRVRSGSRAPDLQNFFDTLRSRCVHHCLRSITVSESGPWLDAGSGGRVIEINTLRPLLAFRGLERVEINPVRCGIDLHDEAVEEFGKAWRNLRVLDLGTHYGWGHKGISLKALVFLIDNCPRLRILNLVIDGTQVKQYSLDKPGGSQGICNETIASLIIGDSKIRKTVAQVAAFLSDILPNVEEISAWDSPDLVDRDEGRKYRKRWQEVSKLLGTFAMVREQERIWKDDSSGDEESPPEESTEDEESDGYEYSESSDDDEEYGSDHTS